LDLREVLSGLDAWQSVLCVNLFGDSLNAYLRHDLKTLIGVPVGGLMIWYLLRFRR